MPSMIDHVASVTTKGCSWITEIDAPVHEADTGADAPG